MAPALADKQHRSPYSSALGLRFLLLAGLSILLLVIDHRYNHLDAARKAIGATVYPLRVIVDAPVSLWRWLGDTTSSRNELQLKNSRLTAERLLTRARLQRYAALEAENSRLRAMLEATTRVRDQVRVAEITITNYVRRNYGILIGEATAERIKHEIGSAFPGQEVREISVKGRNLSEGVPRSFTLNSNEILEALQEPLQGIVGAVKEALEQTPPELGADVADRGIVLSGGSALLRDIDKLLMEETGLPVVIADDPLTCVARGGGRVIELIDEHGPAIFGLE